MRSGMTGSVGLHHPDIMNAVPVPILLVDEDVRILDLNAAATASFGICKETIYQQGGGDALHCLHSYEVPEGCGRGPTWQQGVNRNPINGSGKGASTTRQRMRFEIRKEPKNTQLELLIWATPFP